MRPRYSMVGFEAKSTNGQPASTTESISDGDYRQSNNTMLVSAFHWSGAEALASALGGASGWVDRSMKFLPWKRQARSAREGSYTDSLVNLLVQQAGGGAGLGCRNGRR